MEQYKDKRYQQIFRKFDAMTRTEIVSRLKWIKDRNLTYQAAHEAIMVSAQHTGLPYGKIAMKMAENHGFSNWVTLKCLLLMKLKYEVKPEEIPPFPNKDWQEVKSGVVRRRKENPTSPLA